MFRTSQLLLSGLILLLQIPSLLAQQSLRAIQQQPTAVNQAMIDETEAESPLFSVLPAAARSSQLASELSDYQLLQINTEAQSELIAAAPQELRLALPAGPNGEVLDLQLERVHFLAEGFQIREAISGQLLDASVVGHHYRGQLANDPNSAVALSISEAGGIQGVIAQADGGNLVLGQVDDPTLGPETYVLYPDEQLADQNSFSCQTPDTEVEYDPEMLRINPDQVAGRSDNCVRFFLEVDHDIYQDKNGTAGAAAYISAAFNEVAALYATIGVGITISEILVWEQPSPYQSSSSSGMLSAFQATRTNFNGDLAQLVSYKASGGIAIVNGLCHPYAGAKLSFSSIRSSFAATPTYSWTVMVMAHEMGHQLGSQHTHACVWNGNGSAIDGCPSFTEGNCPVPGIPAGGGNIMSYCHLTQAGINFNVGFGQQPAAVIYNTVAAASCVGTGCGGGNPPVGGGGGNPPVDPPVEECEDNIVYLRLAPDNYGPETTWRIIDGTDATVASGGPYGKMLAGTLILDTLCLPNGCYNFEMLDSYGDGICCEYGDGSFRITDEDGQVLVDNDEFEEEISVNFCLPYTEEPGGDDCVNVSFVDYPPISYGMNQDQGQITVQQNGNQIYLRNNAWKAIEFPYLLTPETVIEFDFRSTIEGEVHGIGFDDNLSISSQFTFRLHGTQSWGNGIYNTYNGSGQWQHFVIPVGEYLLGEASHMFFVADHDNGLRNGNSYFRNIRVYEGQSCDAGSNLNGQASAETVAPSEALGLWPNPNLGRFNVSRPLSSQDLGGEYEIVSATGQLMRSGQLEAGTTNWQLNVQDLTPGTYWLRYRDAQGEHSERFNLQQ
ncbi:MAG: M12 family metallo-peptidase [Bacteroidota bacterium]